MPKINVEKFTVFLDHHISRVPVSYTHHIGGYQIACARTNIVLLRNGDVFLVVVSLKEEQSRPLIQCLHNTFSIVFVNFRVVLSVYDLDETDLVTR